MTDYYEGRVCSDDVETDHFCCKVEMIGCDGTHLDWHRDMSFGPYSALLVLRNSGVGVRTKRVGTVVPNPGDLMIMNVHRLHRTVEFNPGGRIVCLVADFGTKPKLEKVRQRFDESIEFYRKNSRKDR